MIVTAHQPNYLPGLSVVEKLERADAVIWLTEAQYPRGGWTNRNRMPDGSWLTVPVDRATIDGPISRVRIDGDDWRRTHVRTLRQHYGADVEVICDEIERPARRRLLELNLACLAWLTDESRWYFESDFDDDAATISERLAQMVVSIGGSTYLSGPSGRRYLDEAPFAARRIAVDYFDWAGDNPCCLERVKARC